MNFDILSFIFGKLNCGSNFNDVVSYLLGKAVSAVWKTITNVAIASFTAVSSTLRELVVDITPIQSGSGDPSPDNVRPISGWTGAYITRARNNIIDYGSLESGSIDSTTGQNTESDSVIRTPSYLRIDSGTQYTLSGVNANIRVFWYAANYDYLGSDVLANEEVETPANAAFMRLHGLISVISSSICFRREADPADTNCKTYFIGFPTPPGTVYGGTLSDNGDGTWTLQKTMENVDLGTLSWSFSSGAFYSNDLAALIKKPASSSVLGDYLCSALTQKTGIAYWSDYRYNVAQNMNLWARLDGGTTDPAAFKAALSGVYLVYALATPIEYTLTAESVRTLLGQNNIFADCGNINTITYRER